MPVTLPECAGIDLSYHNSPDECPNFRGCLIGDGDRLSPFVPTEFCCRIVWYNWERGYYTRWNPYIDDPMMRFYYTLSEEPCTA